MKAAIVTAAGQAPTYGDFPDPVPAAGKRVVRVAASSLSHLARNRASGTHYSADGRLPFIAGVDGVGVDADGRRVYFVLPEQPYGAMAQSCIVDESHCFALPEELDSVAAAAMAIPGMSSWAALVERARLRAGATVLVNGATGISGRLAIQIARHLGAAKIIATGRRVDSFDDLQRLGADKVIALAQDQDALERDFMQEFRLGIDVVLDYLWGPSAQALIAAAAKAAPQGTPICYVEIGSASGAHITLPGAALRSSGLQLMGSGIGSVSLPAMLQSIQSVLQAAPSAGFEIAVRPMPLADVTTAWTAQAADPRIVLVP